MVWGELQVFLSMHVLQLRKTVMLVKARQSPESSLEVGQRPVTIVALQASHVNIIMSDWDLIKSASLQPQSSETAVSQHQRISGNDSVITVIARRGFKDTPAQLLCQNSAANKGDLSGSDAYFLVIDKCDSFIRSACFHTHSTFLLLDMCTFPKSCLALFPGKHEIPGRAS